MAELDELRSQLILRHRARVSAGWWLLALLQAAGIAACGLGEDKGASEGLAAAAPASVVDSARSIEESLHRFREGLAEVDSLEYASPTRDAAFARFVLSVERRDTAEVRRLAMNRREFAYLYYPMSPHTREPTRQAADVVWFLHLRQSTRGITRVFNRYGGQPFAANGYSCAEPARTEGSNAIWDDCVVHLGTGGDTTSKRLFGGFIRRDGNYKIFSYANDL